MSIQEDYNVWVFVQRSSKSTDSALEQAGERLVESEPEVRHVATREFEEQLRAFKMLVLNNRGLRENEITET